MAKIVSSFLVCLATFFSPQALQARTLIVSDIDDTLKISKIHSFFEKIELAFETQSRFKGMSELLELLSESDSQVEFVYLSNAPEWLMHSSHSEFLSRGGFPEGALLLEGSGPDENHKLNWLRYMIREWKPDRIILLGDNGEKDAEIYGQLVRENKVSGREFFQFIRIVYDLRQGADLSAEQVGFISPVEIALELYRRGVLAEEQTSRFVSLIGSEILSESEAVYARPAYFPEWLSCPQWRWYWSGLQGIDNLLPIEARLTQICAGFNPPWR